MIRGLFIFLTSLLLTGELFPQNIDPDSLLTELSTHSGEEKIGLLFQLSEVFTERNPDSAFLFAQEAYELSESMANPGMMAEAQVQLGSLHSFYYDRERALVHYRNALELYKQTGDEDKLAKTNNNLSQIHYSLNQLEEALDHAMIALRIAREIESEEHEAKALFNMGNISNRMNEQDEAIDYYLQANNIWESLGDKDGLATSYNSLGRCYYGQSDYKKAIGYYEKTLEIRQELNDERGAGIALNNIGNANLQLGNFKLAIDNYHRASEIFKAINFQRGTAATLTGMAVIYDNLDQYHSALEVYKEVLEIRKRLDDQREIANTYNNIAIIYSQMLTDTLEASYGKDFIDTIYQENLTIDNDYSREGIRYNLMSLELRREINDLRGISASLANLGLVYQNSGNFSMARKTFNEYIGQPEEYLDDDSRVAVYIGLGKSYIYEKDYNSAIIYLNQAYRLARKIDKKIYVVDAAELLSEVYERQGNYQKALQSFQDYFEVYDSIFQEETRRQIHEMQVKYETEVTERKNQLLLKDQLINEAKLLLQQRALIAAIIVVFVVIGLLIQLIRQNKLRKKAYEELEKKNQLITEQTKEITDSILYASRIQNAMLPPEEILKDILPEQFLIYRPRDIVSGDFYWITEKDDYIITAVADSTGHGVPGAFMSMLGVAFLNEIVNRHQTFNPDTILNELRMQVIDSLHQTGKEGESQDGMDMALYIINKKNLLLEYAGANNPLIIIRGDELIELKADKMPIGIHSNADKPFQRKKLQLQAGDMLYSFSDGYPDQFGGPKGKKFMIRKFKNLLLEIHGMSLNQQKKILENTLDEWMASANQVDDIIILGVRV